MYCHNLGLAFNKVVQEHGERIALKFIDSPSLTYEALDQLSNQVGRRLEALSLKQPQMICIAGDKTPLTFATMLAALKLGLPYVILDPEIPTDRLFKILTRCQPRAAILGEGLADQLRDFFKDQSVILLKSEEELSRCKILSSEPLPNHAQVEGATPAYVMFTSGSTGFPKGAVITHASVLNLIRWSQESFELSPQDVLTNVNPLYFDNSVFDFYSALFTGAALAVIPKSLVATPKALVERLDQMGCTLWFSTPSLLIYLTTMKVLDKNSLKGIRRFVFGGEGYPKPKLKQLFDLYHPAGTRFFNVYGPTECTCICSLYELTQGDFDSSDLVGLPPIGALAKDFSFLLLNDERKPVGTDEPGELFLLGPNVGAGYLNAPELTAKSFIQNPIHSSHTEIGYLTGDLLSLNSKDGKLYFVARKDNQIKHMGYRIELDEVELALFALPYVSEAAVVHGSIRGISQIVAAISLKERVSDQQILADLRQKLPSYMVPTRLLMKDVLPKNQNGKIDRVQIKKEIFG